MRHAVEFPGTETMFVLLSLAAGDHARVRDGRLDLDLPHVNGGVKVLEDVLDHYDALESRGWVTGDDPPQLTEQGHYALRRWLAKRGRRDVDTRTIRMGVYR